MASPTGLERVHRHLDDLGAGALAHFKAAYFERRLKSRLRIRGVDDAEAYADILDRDPDERGRLLSALAIGVTGFFRNPAAWQRLDQLIRKEAAGRPVRGWSAGCATGEEAWSLALLLDRCAGDGVIPDWSVEATDLDERSLVVARTGSYSDRAAADIALALVTVPGVRAGGHYQVPASLHDRVHFRRADLTGPPPGEGAFDVVLCRNVLIYFDTAAQTTVMGALLDAVRVGGLVMLGKAELAAFEFYPRLEIADRLERVYRRLL